MEFSFENYARIIRAFADAGYKSGSLDSEIADSPRTLYLRHDVDIDIETLPDLCAIERSEGFTSSIFFLPNADAYNPLSAKCLKALQKLSERHTIGLHIDLPSATETELEEHLDASYSYYSRFIKLSRLVSFHRPTRGGAAARPDFIGGFRVTGYDKMNQRAEYFSDSNRREFADSPAFKSAFGEGKAICLLTHPMWWAAQSLETEGILSSIRASTTRNLCDFALESNITRLSDYFASLPYRRVEKSPPIITTDNLVLRPLRPADTGDMFEYASLDETFAYIKRSAHKSRRETLDYILGVTAKYPDGELQWGVELKENGKLIGGCRLYNISQTDMSAEVSYMISPAYRGRGFAVEAVSAAISFAFDELRLDCITADFVEGNLASERVMQKCGMSFLEKLPNAWEKDGEKRGMTRYIIRNI